LRKRPLDFPVSITLDTAYVAEQGFGTILIFDTEKDLEPTYIVADDLNDDGLFKMDSRAYNLASRIFEQRPMPQEVIYYGKVTDNLADGVRDLINDVNDDWYWLVSTADEPNIEEVAKVCATNDKMYMVTLNDLDKALALKDILSNNAFVMYHDDPKSYVAEGMAVIMSYNVGGKTAKFKKVEGVREADITNTNLRKLHDVNIQSYVSKKGILQASEGKVLSGEYLDIILGEYWIRDGMESDLIRLAATNDKIPYTNQGIGMLVGTVTARLQRAVRQGIVESGQYRVDFLRREQVPTNDVASRKYNYIEWVAMLQGAIHGGIIKGKLTYDIVNENIENLQNERGNN